MVTGTMVEIGGLLIVTAATLQVLIVLRSMRLRRALAAKPPSGDVIVKSAGAQDIEPLSWLGKRRFQVAMRTYETANRQICSYYLVPLDRRPIPSFRPGQFLTFEVPIPGQDHPAMRCYSLSDSPSERGYYRVSVRKLSEPAGLVSSHFHEEVREGDVVEAYAPAGEFCLDCNSRRPVVLIAGGVGLTPLLSMLNWLVANDAGREVWLFYGVRDRADHAMYDHLTHIRQSCPNVRMFIAYSRPGPACRLGVDYNVDGRISLELLQSVLTASDYEFYLCGPSVMMTSLRDGLAEWGVPSEDIRYEAFQALSDTTADTGETPAPETAGKTYRVEFARSGRVLEWTGDSGADTLLELAEANGVKMRCSCRAGNCGTCVTAIADGSVEYVRPPSREHDAGTCLPCIARPRSDIVLDL